MENHCIMIAMECGYIRALGGISSARCSLRTTVMIAMMCGQDEHVRALGGISSARCSLRSTVTFLNEIVKMKRKFTRNKDKAS